MNHFFEIIVTILVKGFLKQKRKIPTDIPAVLSVNYILQETRLTPCFQFEESVCLVFNCGIV